MTKYANFTLAMLEDERAEIEREIARRIVWRVTKTGDDPDCTHPSDRRSFGMTGSKALCVECGAWLVAE